MTPTVVPTEPTEEERIRWYLTREWPLHVACSWRESLPVVEYLHNQNPDWVRTMDKLGWPVHRLLAINDVEIPPWKQVPDDLYISKIGESIPIDVLEFLLDKYPPPLRYMETRYWDYSPLLFKFVCFPAALNAVQLVFEKTPAAIRSRFYQRFPLHGAVIRKESHLDVVKFLLHQYPASVGFVNRVGNLPLHSACCCVDPFLLGSGRYQEELTTTNVPVLKFLRNANPAAVNVRNKWGDLPLHGACYKMESLEFLQVLVDDTKPATRSASDRRPLPLHFAILSSSPLGVMQRLVEIDPTAATVRNEDGDLPLHLACQCKASVEVIQLLLEKNAAAVNIANNMGFYPLQVACHSNACVDVLLLLLKSNPVILQRMFCTRF